MEPWLATAAINTIREIMESLLASRVPEPVRLYGLHLQQQQAEEAAARAARAAAAAAALAAGRACAGWDAALPPPVDPVDGSVAAAAAAAVEAAVAADVVASERHNEVVRAALSEYRRIGYAPQLGAAALSGRSTVAETCNQMHQRCAVWLQGASDPATRLEDSVRDQLTAFVKQLRDKLEGAPPARPGHESGEPVLPTPRASQCCAPLAGKGPTAGLCRVTGALDCSDAKNPGPEVPGRCKRHCRLKAQGCPAHGPKGAAASAGAMAKEGAAGRSRVPRAAAAGVAAAAAAAGATSPSAPRSAANVAASGDAAASVGPAAEGGVDGSAVTHTRKRSRAPLVFDDDIGDGRAGGDGNDEDDEDLPEGLGDRAARGDAPADSNDVMRC